MINNKSVLAVIPARGGSKGLPRKNILKVGGKTLLQYTFEQAEQSEYIDRIILSSDDEEIIRTAKKLGCEVPFKRPDDLSTDTSGTMPVVFHALDELTEEYDFVIVLQVTSPLRSSDDIDNCIELCERKKAPSCLSVVANDKPLEWIFTLSNDDKIIPITDSKIPARRQDATEIYSVNGAIAVAKVDWLRLQDHFLTDETIAYEMPKSRSLDIDSEDDLLQLKMIIKDDSI